MEGFREICERSESFPVDWPTHANTFKYVQEEHMQRRLGEMAREAAVVVHPRVLQCIRRFLALKQSHLSVHQWIQRAMACRPLMFMGRGDVSLKRDGFAGVGWQVPPGDPDYMSYDELVLSALLGASTPTFFINDGDRNNCGAARWDEAEGWGIHLGLVGARFEQLHQMESLACLCVEGRPQEKLQEANTLWAPLYGVERFPTYEEARAQEGPLFVKLRSGFYFNVSAYKTRIKLTVETMLLEASSRARAAGKSAFVSQVGLGLGVWRKLPNQAQYFVEAHMEALREHRYPHVAVLNFAYIREEYSLPDQSVNGVEVRFNRRNPSARLVGADAGLLLVATFAWDGNSFVGNEYWRGQLAASGDPAAACCSFIPQLLNPLTNPAFTRSFRICTGASLVFDIGNVLLRWDPRALIERVFAHREQKPFALLDEVIGKEYWLELDAGREGQLPEGLSVSHADVQEFAVGFAKHMEPLEEVVALMHLAKQSGVATFLLSNMPRQAWGFISREHAFLRGHEGHCISGLVGHIKPSAEIYSCVKQMLQEAGCDAGQALFFDDTLCNVEASIQSGISAVHVTSAADVEQALRERNLIL